MATTSMEGVAVVELANGATKEVRWDGATTVGKVVGVVVGWLAGSETETGHFALRLVHQPHGPATPPADLHWLHRSLPFGPALARYQGAGPAQHWRLQLRVRYLPADLREMFHTQRPSFAFFYDQVRADYMEQVAWKVERSLALRLGCLEVRRFLKDMSASALDKKANLEFLEREIGLERFFPAQVLEEEKRKGLRKALGAELRRLAPLSEAECCFAFLDALAAIARYDVEIFKCSLGVGWRVPVEVVVGPSLGLAYVADDRSEPKRLLDMAAVLDIWTEADTAGKARVRIRVSGASEPLVLTCPNLNIAESLADLVDGYRFLSSQDHQSVWSRREEGVSGSERRPSAGRVEAPGAAEERSPEEEEEEDGGWEDVDADYSRPRDSALEIPRSALRLAQLLGEGQFGDVYRALYRPSSSSSSSQALPVAVKASKLSRDDSHAQNFLHEAHIMRHFNHPHIVGLIGLCLDSPIWIVMELAELGELRAYLIAQGPAIGLPSLLLFCQQLASALSYLKSKRFVHRDIAARNCLVASPSHVKLSDFGLSRCLQTDSYYTASRGKLPIKWMAVESISYRRFTHASDVWMLGVAFWEILMRGVKPFQGVRNADVIGKLESGERLGKPELCPPRLYALLNHMWQYNPQDRPSVSAVRDSLQELVLLEGGESEEARQAQLSQSLRKLSWGADDLQPMDGYAQATPKKLRVPPSLPTRSAAHLTPKAEPENAEDEAWLEEQSSGLRLPKPASPSPQPAQANGRGADESPPGIPLLPPQIPADMEVCRSDDGLYEGVVEVVRAVSELSRGPESELVAGVRSVGGALRELLRRSEEEGRRLAPPLAQRLCLAEKLLSSDMQKLVEAMKRALEFAATTLDVGSRKAVLAEAHVLAVDSKAFLETADALRHLSRPLPLRPKAAKPTAPDASPSSSADQQRSSQSSPPQSDAAPSPS